MTASVILMMFPAIKILYIVLILLFKQNMAEVSVSAISPTFLRTATDKEKTKESIVFTVQVSNAFLKEAHKLKQDISAITYCEIVNHSLDFCCASSDRLEERYSNLVRKFASDWRQAKTKGSK